MELLFDAEPTLTDAARRTEVGWIVGGFDGELVGTRVGLFDGCAVGTDVGDDVGVAVG